MATQAFVLNTLVPEVCPDDISYPNSANLTGKQYRFVKVTTTILAVCTAGTASKGDRSIGVLQDGTDGSTRPTVSAVRTGGLTKIVLGEDSSLQTYVKSDANGAAIAAVTGDNAEGYLLNGGNSGECAVMRIQHVIVP